LSLLHAWYVGLTSLATEADTPINFLRLVRKPKRKEAGREIQQWGLHLSQSAALERGLVEEMHSHSGYGIGGKRGMQAFLQLSLEQFASCTSGIDHHDHPTSILV